MRRFLLFCLLCLWTGNSFAQCLRVDSLRQLLMSSYLSDTAKINVMNQLGREYLINKQTAYALGVARQAFQYAESKHYKIGMGDALLIIGDANFQSDDIHQRDNECVPNYTKALEFFQETKDNKHIALAYKTLGDYYYNLSYQQKEYEHQALDYYLMYVKTTEKLDDKEGLAQAYENIGYLFETMGDEARSTEYFLKVINLKQEIEQKNVNNPHIFSKTQKYYNLQIENQRLFSSIFLGGAGLLAVIVLILYFSLAYRRRAHRLLQRQKEEIQLQKEAIEVKNTELERQKEEISAQRDQLAYKTEELAQAQVLIKQKNEMLMGMNQRLEQKVAERTAQLQKTNEMLTETNRELDTLIYRASHDFKGPVATLTGLSYIGKLECEEFTPAVEILGKIEDVAGKMDKMLIKLHQVSYIISKELTFTAVCLPQVIENVCRTLEKTLEAHPLDITLDISPAFKLETDAEILEMMMENIIENAALYRRSSAFPAPILHITAQSHKQETVISFQDNGHGVPADFLSKAFDMFSRGTELAKGNGLGLYVVKQGLERLAGKEYIESSEGLFTRISLHFDMQAMMYHYRAQLLESLDWGEL